jgi:ABC-type transport system involved in cytochrome bd biosynthesis fused ATPase/permease subunit
MRWVKVGLIAVGALIAFIVVQSVLHLLYLAFIALAIGVVIAVAVKARSQYRIAREHRAQLRQEKAERKPQARERSAGHMTGTPAWMPQDTVPSQDTVPPRHDVEDELARLKREMGTS